jgi:hypothetical protein
MKYLRGSPEQLTGRAVIFSDLKEQHTLTSGEVGLGLITVFCAASEVDLLELIIQVMRLPREHSRLINHFYKRYFQELEEIKRSFPEKISQIITEILDEEEEKQEVSEPIREAFREMFRANSPGEDKQHGDKAQKPGKLPQPDFYSTMIPLPNREFIKPYTLQEGFDFDIIDLERSDHLGIGHLVLDAHARLYVAEHMIQKEKQIVLPSDQKYKSPHKNYKELSREEFKQTLTELSSELMFLIETKRDTGRVFADLKQLTGGSHLMGEVVSLYNISTTQDPNKIKLMELYFRKIFSLIDENYLLTKEISEEIQKYGV